jgi:hypothetical protein
MKTQKETNNKEISRKDALKKIGDYGKYAALTAIGTYTLLSPKKAQASSPEDPGTGFRVNEDELDKLTNQQDEGIFDGFGDMDD